MRGGSTLIVDDAGLRYLRALRPQLGIRSARIGTNDLNVSRLWNARSCDVWIEVRDHNEVALIGQALRFYRSAHALPFFRQALQPLRLGVRKMFLRNKRGRRIRMKQKGTPSLRAVAAANALQWVSVS